MREPTQTGETFSLGVGLFVEILENTHNSGSPLDNVFTDGSYTKGTQAHTHRELIRQWLWEPKGNSLEYI